MNKQELINYLNEYLRISDFQDSSKNGLQIDNSKKEIKKIGYAVDATSYIFEKWVKENVDIILVHHWIFWGFEQVLVWVPYKRAKIMIENDIALAAYHIPLDAHDEVGNNIWLLEWFVKTFDLQNYEKEKIIEYKWEKIWFGLKFDKSIPLDDVVNKYCKNMKLLANLYNFDNKKEINSVAFCSGGALSEVTKVTNYDLYITGEGKHEQVISAKELWQNILLAGHRETEKIWPELLAKHLQEKFGLEIVFLDEKY